MKGTNTVFVLGRASCHEINKPQKPFQRWVNGSSNNEPKLHSACNKVSIHLQTHIGLYLVRRQDWLSPKTRVIRSEREPHPPHKAPKLFPMQSSFLYIQYVRSDSLNLILTNTKSDFVRGLRRRKTTRRRTYFMPQVWLSRVLPCTKWGSEQNWVVDLPHRPPNSYGSHCVVYGKWTCLIAWEVTIGPNTSSPLWRRRGLLVLFRSCNPTI